MKQRKLKKSVTYVILLALVGCVIGGVNLLVNNLTLETVHPVNEPINEVIPVISKNIIEKPYTNEDVTILNNYYDYKDEENNQLNAIIYFDNTYMQNTGIIYGSDNVFDVKAIYDGEVIRVSDSDLSGKIVEIRHSNDLISVYQLLSTVNVSVNTKIKQGDIIGKSGISNLVDNTKNQLYFELILRGELVNPENYYGKTIEEI